MTARRKKRKQPEPDPVMHYTDRIIIDRPSAGGYIIWWTDVNEARFISKTHNYAYDLDERQLEDLPELIKPKKDPYKKAEQLTLF